MDNHLWKLDNMRQACQSGMSDEYLQWRQFEVQSIDNLISARVDGLNEHVKFRNPKRYLSVRSGRWNWYGYYAGYSPDFVEDIIEYLQLGPNSSLLDPWNGIGTTTLVAQRAGIDAYGFDINPALTMIARSLLVPEIELKAIDKQVQSLLRNIDVQTSIDPDDLLLTWFQPASCAVIRSIESGIRKRLIVDSNESASDSAFLYLAVFRTVRNLLKKFGSSNPTWIKEPSSSRQRLRPSTSNIVDTFCATVDELIDRDDCKTVAGITRSVKLGTSASWNIPLPSNSIDAVISSPPYCTRLDYAVATKPELAVIGLTSSQFKRLRTQMIGSPTIDSKKIVLNPDWGQTCNTFLSAVNGHNSKASESYYLKTYMQYFEGMFTSLKEIDRVLKPGGRCALVVQDSYYKDIHVNICKILFEMGRTLGWSSDLVQDFVNSKSFAGVNSRSRKYRPVCLPTESVVVMKKALN